jgi:ABC-type branched-subunit amino acid transport system permease subunit
METGIVQIILLVAFVFLIVISCLATYRIGRKLLAIRKLDQANEEEQ